MFCYENLSPQDFEELCSDIVCRHFNAHFERFKPGKDKGIDLRLIENNSTHTIVQVKHTPGSYSSKHRTALKNEFAAFKKHGHVFRKYILITSAKLSGENKREIVEISGGVIKSETDILGFEFIEDFLRQTPEVIRQHYKLWLSNAEVIKLVLHSKVYGKSEDYLARLLNRKNWFVQTQFLQEGINRLKQKKNLLIRGDPGVGKTFHAEMICLSFVADGFEFIYAESIDEAEEVFSKTSKQVFFIDDFMGANFLDLFKENTENKIIRFMDRIRTVQNKYVVFCSRTTIFNSALQRSIHLRNKKLEKRGMLLKVEQYSDIEKTKILYNHLVYRDLDRKYFETVRSSRLYLKIVRHKNFNPRLIEFITSTELIEDEDDIGYLKLIEYYLENPGEIWDSAYENQLNDESRWLLQTLFTLNGNCEEEKLQDCYDVRLKYEIENSNHVPSSSPYENSIKILLNGFITREISESWLYDVIRTEVSFRNPSISDYLLKYLLTNKYPLQNSISSAIYFSQIKFLIISNLIPGQNISQLLFDVYRNKRILKTEKKETVEEQLLILISLAKFDVDLKIICDIFNQLIRKKKNADYNLLVQVFNHITNSVGVDKLEQYNLNANSIFYVLLKSIPKFRTIYNLIKKAKSYEIDLVKKFLENPSEEIEEACHKVCESEAEAMLADDEEFQHAIDPEDIEAAADSVAEQFYANLSDFDFLTVMEYDAFNIDYFALHEDRIEDMKNNETYQESVPSKSASDEQLMRVFYD